MTSESEVCCEECGVMWRVWCVVESVVCCGENDVMWRVQCDVESVVCRGEHGVFSVVERKLKESKRL